MSVHYPHITTAILAGGKSRRMGQPKALLSVGAHTFLEHLCQTFAPLTAAVLIAGEPAAGLYASANATLITDTLVDAGPLAGMYAAMQAATTPYLFAVPCDMPLVDESILQALWQAMQTAPQDVITVSAHGREQQLVALFDCSLAPALAVYLQQGGRKVLDFYAQHRTQVLDLSDHAEKLSNINSPEDYQAARACFPAD